MTVFISGKITGNPNYREQFKKRAKDLELLGYTVYDPCSIGDHLKEELGREPTYDEYMQRDLKYLDNADAINFLPNWQESKGSNIEYNYAKSHNKPIIQIKMLDYRRHSDVRRSRF